MVGKPARHAALAWRARSVMVCARAAQLMGLWLADSSALALMVSTLAMLAGGLAFEWQIVRPAENVARQCAERGDRGSVTAYNRSTVAMNWGLRYVRSGNWG